MESQGLSLVIVAHKLHHLFVNGHGYCKANIHFAVRIMELIHFSLFFDIHMYLQLPLITQC